MLLKYVKKEDYINFWCVGLDEKDKDLAPIFNDFFLDMSIERKVFFYAYRLPDAWITDLIEPEIILAKAGNLSHPFTTFLHLSRAKIKSNFLDRACEATIYFFENEVEWTDFLASSVIQKPRKLIKQGILSACFVSGDYGADFWFGCNKSYEGRVLLLFEELSKKGYDIKRVFHLDSQI